MKKTGGRKSCWTVPLSLEFKETIFENTRSTMTLTVNYGSTVTFFSYSIYEYTARWNGDWFICNYSTFTKPSIYCNNILNLLHCPAVLYNVCPFHCRAKTVHELYGPVTYTILLITTIFLFYKINPFMCSLFVRNEPSIFLVP